MNWILQGRLTQCLLLTYRVPVKQVTAFLPRPLEPLTHEGFAFWNIVVCRLAGLRLQGWPAWCGVSYRHVAYRLLVRCPIADGTTLEGLYFVRSDADHRLLALAGNRLSPFHFHYSPMRWDERGSQLELEGDYPALLRVQPGRSPKPSASCFSSEQERRRMLTYQPLALAPGKGRVALAEVVRDPLLWRESDLQVLEAHWAFFRGMEEVRLEQAVEVALIDYVWKLGRSLPLP